MEPTRNRRTAARDSIWPYAAHTAARCLLAIACTYVLLTLLLPLVAFVQLRLFDYDILWALLYPWSIGLEGRMAKRPLLDFLETGSFAAYRSHILAALSEAPIPAHAGMSAAVYSLSVGLRFLLGKARPPRRATSG